MPKFSFVRKVPSCLVTKDLLSTIEAYLNVEIRKKLGAVLGDTSTYRVSITEKIGTETLASISEYTSTTFSDATKKVEISWNNGCRSDFSLNITINFDPDYSYFSSVRVQCNATTARETATGIGDAILRLLDSNRTYNWIFNPFPVPILVPILSGVALFLLVLGASIIQKNQQLGLYYISGTVFAGWFIFSALYFRPFVSFDTPRQRMLDNVWRYFSLGMFGFIFFGTLLPLVRRALVGF